MESLGYSNCQSDEHCQIQFDNVTSSLNATCCPDRGKTLFAQLLTDSLLFNFKLRTLHCKIFVEFCVMLFVVVVGIVAVVVAVVSVVDDVVTAVVAVVIFRMKNWKHFCFVSRVSFWLELLENRFTP